MRRPILRGREHGVTGRTCAAPGLVRTDAQETDLDTEATLPFIAAARAPRLSRVRAIGVQLDRPAAALESGVVPGLATATKPRDPRIARSAADDPPHAP